MKTTLTASRRSPRLCLGVLCLAALAACDANTDFTSTAIGRQSDDAKKDQDQDSDDDGEDGPGGPATVGATGTGTGTDTAGNLGTGDDGATGDGTTNVDESGEQVDIQVGDDGITFSRATFRAGGTVTRQVPSDYLIVIDNSVSMNPYLDKVRLGFLNIPIDRFGVGAKVAVMSGMASKRDDFSKTHAGIVRYTNIEKEPGFLSLVTAAQIAGYKADTTIPKANRDKYPLPGCTGAWFAPDGKAADGSSCLAAALQTAATGVGCEANVVAVEQMMAKLQGQKVFRDGAFVHVIFVSDETHPGCNNADLLADCGTFAATDAAVRGNAAISGLKFHGIVRPTPASGARKDCAYQRHIEGSGGVYLDIGDDTVVDYRQMIEKVIESTTPESLVYQFAAKPASIRRIVIDGERYNGPYDLDDTGLLVIRDLDMTVAHDVELSFVP